MNIIRPYARMLSPHPGRVEDGEPYSPMEGIALLKRIEWCARISHRTEEAVTMDSWRRFIEQVVMKHGDWSVVEHAVVSVDMVVDRGITHEWVRHRLNAFTQESTRFVNYEKKMPPSFIYPKVDVECEHCLAGHTAELVSVNTKVMDSSWHKRWVHEDSYGMFVSGKREQIYKICGYDADWLDAIATAEDKYKGLLAKKWRPQEARSVFPNALASRIITTSNLRNWRHMFIMRTSAEAHPQMRQVMIPLLKEFQEKIPLLFDDLVPEQKQSEAMKRAR